MKVYINARFLTQNITGVQQFAWEICRNLRPGKHEFILLAPKNVKQPPALAHLGFITIGKSKGYTWEQIELPRFLTRSGRPLLLNFCNTAPLLYSNQFVTIHDLSFMHHPEWYSASFAKVYRFMIPRIAKRSRKIVTVSETIRKEITALLMVDPAKVSVLYNGLSAAVLNTGREKLQKEKIILTVSSINPRKNLKTLIEAFLASEMKDHTLLIAGAMNDVFAKSNFQVADPRVQFLGYVSDEELMHLYKKSEIFASLSLDEGFGIPVLEAAYFYCKLLLSDIPVYHELFSGIATFTHKDNAKAAGEKLSVLGRSPAIPDPIKLSSLMMQFSYRDSAARLVKLIEESL